MNRRPTFINLLLIRLPVTALSSITHRLAGIANFFIAIPTFVILFLTSALITEQETWAFEMFTFEIKLLISISILSVTYHLFSGLRHLLIDFTNYGHELPEAKNSAIIAFILTVATSATLFMEVW